MPFKRIILQDGGISRNARAGDTVTNPVIITVAADANDTVNVARLSGGVVQYTGFTVSRTLTTETAALFLAAFPEMDIGDAYNFKVSVVPAFAGTWAAGVGVTLAGKLTVPAATEVNVYVIKTSATTVTWNTL